MSSFLLKRHPLAWAVCVACLPVWANAAPVETTLEDVVVTATLSPSTKASTPAFSTVITADDIAKTPVNSLPDLLRETVGVNNQTDNTGRDEIQIRGLDGRYTLILVDGKRVSSSGALWRGTDFDLSAIPLASIERVEVVRGSMSAMYGSDAIGGVINIITKRPGKEWHGQVVGEYRKVSSGDQGDQQRLSVQAAGAVSDSVSLSVAAEAYERDAWFTNSASSTTEVAALEEKHSRNLVTTAKVQLSSTQSLDLDLGYNKDERPYALTSYKYYPAWNYSSYTYSSQEIERYSYGVTHNGTWSWGKSVTYLKYEDADINEYNSSYNAPKQRSLKEQNTYVKSYGVVKAANQTVTAGVDYRSQLIKDPATYLQTGKVTNDDVALFGQDAIALGDSLLLTMGGRLDQHDVFGSHFSPKGYLNYYLSDAVTIKGGVSKSFKAPDAYQTSSEYSIISCGGSCYLSGNPNLKPETGTSYEVGAEWRQRGWNLSAVVFQNDVQDMIVAVYDSSVPSRQWKNIEKAKTSGLELDGAVDLNSVLSLTGNLTLLTANYTDSSGVETKLENRPEQKARVGLSWKVSDKFSALVAANYVGRQYYEDEELPAYTRYDLSTSTQINKALMLRAGIKNLTDVNLKDKNGNFLSNELGRNYYVSLAYAF